MNRNSPMIRIAGENIWVTSSSWRKTRRPGNRRRASAYPAGIAMARVRIVETPETMMLLRIQRPSATTCHTSMKFSGAQVSGSHEGGNRKISSLGRSAVDRR